MILNRYDYNRQNGTYYGVGYNLLEHGSFDKIDVTLLKQLLDLRRSQYGNGVIAIDGGANIGVHTIEWARHMIDWGYVISIEAQERIFYALAGNIALNNCFNARALNAALGNIQGNIKIPVPDYTKPASFGSLELIQSPHNENIGQNIDYSLDLLTDVAMLTIDSFNLPRLDLLKIDVEGMEFEVLEGAKESLKNLKPIIFIEHLKVGKENLANYLQSIDYIHFDAGINFVAIHKYDEIAEILSKSFQNQ